MDRPDTTAAAIEYLVTRKIGLLSRGMEIKMRSGAAFILLAVVAALASAKPQNRQIEGNHLHTRKQYIHRRNFPKKISLQTL